MWSLLFIKDLLMFFCVIRRHLLINESLIRTVFLCLFSFILIQAPVIFLTFLKTYLVILRMNGSRLLIIRNNGTEIYHN